MSDPIPLSLFHTGRAQCPECGAPLTLADAKPRVECTYCGAASVVERRLRMIEPIVAPDLITLDAPADAARRVRGSQVIPVLAQDESHCPTCGAEMDGSSLQAIRKCLQCGTESKVERRLVRRGGVDEDLASLEREVQERDRKAFAVTQALIDRIVDGTDLPNRVRAAHEFTDGWNHLNLAAVKQLPRLLDVLRSADARLDIPLAEFVGKLLCEGDPRLARVAVRAAEKFTFDENGSRSLLWQLGLGAGIALKLLLDSADYAATRGGVNYACAALWAVNAMIERHYADRVTLCEIVLYRLLYLRGPVQAWAIELANGQMGLGVRFPTPTLLRFMDDCACERPELVPHIRDCFYTPAAKTEADYLARLSFIDELLTLPAKCAALEQLFAPPREMPEPALLDVLEKLLGYALQPSFAPSALCAINAIFEEYPGPREAAHQFIRSHGDSLPEPIRRAYLRHVPDSKLLSPLKVQYTQSDPPRAHAVRRPARPMETTVARGDRPGRRLPARTPAPSPRILGDPQHPKALTQPPSRRRKA